MVYLIQVDDRPGPVWSWRGSGGGSRSSSSLFVAVVVVVVIVVVLVVVVSSYLWIYLKPITVEQIGEELCKHSKRRQN